MLKYKPFKKYLVSSFEIENLVLSISFKRDWESILILLPISSTSIIGKSSFGRQPKENLELPDLKVRNFPLLEMTSSSLLSGSFLIISYIV